MKDTEDIIKTDLEEENPEQETVSEDIETDNSSQSEETNGEDFEEEKKEEEQPDIKEVIKSFQPLDYFDYVNLHINSKYSDGKADFEDIIRQAKEMG